MRNSLPTGARDAEYPTFLELYCETAPVPLAVQCVLHLTAYVTV